jgi:hypothetical protein
MTIPTSQNTTTHSQAALGVSHLVEISPSIAYLQSKSSFSGTSWEQFTLRLSIAQKIIPGKMEHEQLEPTSKGVRLGRVHLLINALSDSHESNQGPF